MQRNKGFTQIVLLVIVVIALVTGGVFLYQQKSGSNNLPPQSDQSQSSETVKSTGSKYKTVSQKPTGWFITGQDADIMLSGVDFNNTGGPLLFNHPGAVASDGTHLLLADTYNNRVLIWNKLPGGNTPPDFCLLYTSPSPRD